MRLDRHASKVQLTGRGIQPQFGNSSLLSFHTTAGSQHSTGEKLDSLQQLKGTKYCHFIQYFLKHWVQIER